MKIGITGSRGNLGSYLKNQFREYKLDYFNGRIENKSDVNKWIEGKNFDAIIHLAAIVPTSVVNKHKNKALDVNFN
jgi:dTDP-4-dehydrorhamnose reductase